MIDYRELLKKYIQVTYKCLGNPALNAIHYELSVDSGIKSEHKKELIDLMSEARDE